MESAFALAVIAGLIVMAFMFGSTNLSFFGALGAVAIIVGVLITVATIVGGTK